MCLFLFVSLQLEDCLYDERNALLDDLQLDMLEQTHQEAMQFTSSLLEHDDDDEDDDVSVWVFIIELELYAAQAA